MLQAQTDNCSIDTSENTYLQFFSIMLSDTFSTNRLG